MQACIEWEMSSYWIVLAGLFAAPVLFAQDVLEFDNGEKLIGKFERSNGGSVTFKSDTLGQITADWSKVKELHSAEIFAVVPKGVELQQKNADLSKIPEGAITVADQKITVTPVLGQPKTVSIPDVEHVETKSSFDRAVLDHHGFFTDWRGEVTAGAALVEATQQSRTFTGAINLVRTAPDEDWLRRRERTTVNFTAAYGILKQPATPTVKTEIFHADAERDEYFSASTFAFAQAAFDHNFSQGLDLQQSFGGGIGWSAIKRANQNLDLKGGVTYVRQNFAAVSADQNLTGSIFEEDYQRGLRRGIKFKQQLIFTPAWNNPDALTGIGNALLTMPVYKRTNFTLGVIDNYLHDPPPGFKKNSFQATMGLTYMLR
jgi:hypothetical protein